MKPTVGKYYVFHAFGTVLYRNLRVGKCIEYRRKNHGCVFQVWSFGWRNEKYGDGHYWFVPSHQVVKEIPEHELSIYLLEEM